MPSVPIDEHDARPSEEPAPPREDAPEEPSDSQGEPSGEAGGGRAPNSRASQVAIEREITKRRLIEAITYVIVMVLYMGFTLMRDREATLVPLDPENDGGPDDDWAEA